MKIHLLRVDRPVLEFEGLIAAVRHHGDRIGWLELAPAEAATVAPGPLPESLETAARFGVLRAVAISSGHGVGGRYSVAVKPMVGQAVLHDVLREHFRGCRLVLLLGDVDAPLLEPQGDDWQITTPGEASRWTTDRLVAALAKPQPW